MREIEAEASRVRTLDDLVRALKELGPETRRQIVTVVIQDEYSHDVVVRWDHDVYVVYGTT